MVAFFQKNIVYYGTIIFLLIVGGVMLLFTTKDMVTLWVNVHYNQFLDSFFLTLNWLGEPVFSILVVIVLGIFKNWKIALKAAVCFLVVMGVTQFMKYVLFPGELRPTLYFGKDVLRLIEGVVQLETESFPSGHTSAAFSLATFFALLLPWKRWHWLLALTAALVGYGRIYLSQHFITDVYTGMIIGVVLTTVVYYFYPEKVGKR